jgi:hypothetical protein
MNNYLSLNLVNGKLGRVAGGGRPKFVLDEPNEVQLYVLDFPKPSTYPPSSLSDAYAYEIIPRDFSGSSVTLKAGVRGGSSIISTNSLFNLPTNLALNSSATLYNTQVGAVSSRRLTINVFFSLSSIPSSGSLFSFTVTVNSLVRSSTIISPSFSFDNLLSNIESILNTSIINALTDSQPTISILPDEMKLLIQTSDYSYSFYSYYAALNASSNGYSISVTLNNVSASSNPGKYGYLDFSSSSWDSVIGTKVEAPIWMEAVIDGQTISQGNAIICRKMT